MEGPPPTKKQCIQCSSEIHLPYPLTCETCGFSICFPCSFTLTDNPLQCTPCYEEHNDIVSVPDPMPLAGPCKKCSSPGPLYGGGICFFCHGNICEDCWYVCVRCGRSNCNVFPCAATDHCQTGVFKRHCGFCKTLQRTLFRVRDEYDIYRCPQSECRNMYGCTNCMIPTYIEYGVLPCSDHAVNRKCNYCNFGPHPLNSFSTIFLDKYQQVLEVCELCRRKLSLIIYSLSLFARSKGGLSLTDVIPRFLVEYIILRSLEAWGSHV